MINIAREAKWVTPVSFESHWSVRSTVGIAQDHGPRACLRDRFVMRRVYATELECAIKFILK